MLSFYKAKTLGATSDEGERGKESCVLPKGGVSISQDKKDLSAELKTN